MIRLATVEDMPQILAIYAPYVENTTVSFEYEAPAPDAFLQRFQSVTADFPWLVWEEAGQILGYAYAARPFERPAYSWCAEPSIYLRPDARGRGLGAKLYAALEEILKRQGYCRLYAIITAENQSSLRFHEKMGYRNVGQLHSCGWKLGRWCSIIWMEKSLISTENPVGFPISFPTFIHYHQNVEDILWNLSIS